MYGFVRPLASLTFACAVAAGCAAAAATQSPSAAPVDPPPAVTAPPDSTPLVITPMPLSPTPTIALDSKAPAVVTVTGTHSLVKDVTRTTDGDCQRVGGGVVAGSGTASDARFSGTSRFEVSGTACDDVGFEYGTMRIENPGGAWEGFCSGGIWNGENSSDLACWLSGSGAYDGLTAYFHTASGGAASDSIAVILPLPAPKQ